MKRGTQSFFSITAETWNINAYNQGTMGYKTPNTDRIATEGALFTD